MTEKEKGNGTGGVMKLNDGWHPFIHLDGDNHMLVNQTAYPTKEEALIALKKAIEKTFDADVVSEKHEEMIVGELKLWLTPPKGNA